jgi:predicted permease
LNAVFLKAGVFLAIILTGFLLKKAGLFQRQDFVTLGKLMLNLTVPCLIISNFSRLALDASLFLLILVGICCNALGVLFGYLAGLKKERQERAFNMINYSGYSVGCFTMPFAQSFLGPMGVIALGLFDLGNAFFCNGGTYAMASAVIGQRKDHSPWALFRPLLTSPVVVIYILMLLLSTLHITLPEAVLSFTDTISAANSFIAMLMVGIGLEIRLGKDQGLRVLRVLGMRLIFACIVAFLCIRFLPLPLEARQAAALVAFAPVSAPSVAYTEKCGGNIALASAINSMSILCSVFVMPMVLLALQIA